jgi:hypothetical protein
LEAAVAVDGDPSSITPKRQALPFYRFERPDTVVREAGRRP